MFLPLLILWIYEKTPLPLSEGRLLPNLMSACGCILFRAAVRLASSAVGINRAIPLLGLLVPVAWSLDTLDAWGENISFMIRCTLLSSPNSADLDGNTEVAMTFPPWSKNSFIFLRVYQEITFPPGMM